MNKLQLLTLFKMGRFFVLVAGLIAYALGLSMAYHDLGFLDPFKAIIGLIILISATLAAHYTNEYTDVDTDSLTRRTWFSRGSGVLLQKFSIFEVIEHNVLDLRKSEIFESSKNRIFFNLPK